MCLSKDGKEWPGLFSFRLFISGLSLFPKDQQTAVPGGAVPSEAAWNHSRALGGQGWDSSKWGGGGEKIMNGQSHPDLCDL